MRALISIHDVMPESLSEVGALVERCEGHGASKLTLLVVPGLDWGAADLDTLRAWVADGHRLAAHGWLHRCGPVRGLWHRAHSRFLSRGVAEHLSLVTEAIAELMAASSDWFSEHGFERPALYVPPAWALGRVPPARLRALPFQMIETLGGVHLVGAQRRVRLPLVGFEADDAWRRLAVTAFNRCNLLWAGRSAAPLRLAIHPYDARLSMSEDLDRALAQSFEPILYDTLLPAAPGRTGSRAQRFELA